MTDTDPNIKVELTVIGEDMCIVAHIHDVRIKMHTRSAVDLNHKLSLAILDWLGKAIRHVDT